MPFVVELETPRSRLLVWRSFLDAEEQKAFKAFTDTVNFGAEVIRGFTARRTTFSYGEFEETPGVPMFYKYSGKVQRANGWPAPLKHVLDKCWAEYEKFVRTNPLPNTPKTLHKSNYCLLNHYDGLKSGIGKHADAEKGLWSLAPILSMSILARRLFRIYSKTTSALVKSLMINSGTLVIMDGAFQQEFLHEVPKDLKTEGNEDGVRINATFRSIIYDDSQKQLALEEKQQQQPIPKLATSPFFAKKRPRAAADEDGGDDKAKKTKTDV